MNYKLIAAKCNNNGIGYKNSLPWHFKTDLKFFSKITTGNGNNAIIMGRKTWESLPNKILPNRDNIVLTSKQPNFDYSKHTDNNINKLYFIDSIEGIIMFCDEMEYDDVWIIGGTSLYSQFLDRPEVTSLYITIINNNYLCDTFFPPIPSSFKITHINSLYDTDRRNKNTDKTELKFIICTRDQL